MRAEMAEFEEENWSAVAQEAFRKHLSELAKPKDMPLPELLFKEIACQQHQTNNNGCNQWPPMKNS